ncbi:unnamed protein product [Debaryomyces tyrocola]|nr:unnamed protein product [Debaryomyces tyrocola]
MVADTKRSSYEDLEDFKVGELSLLSLHKSLVDTPSVSKSELKISQLLKDYLEKAGLTVELQMVGSGQQRYNVYAYIGKVRDTKVLITSHIDTVPPFLPYRIEGTNIYGRGSCDAKGSVATQIMSYLSLFKSGDLKEGDASLLFVVDEEFSGLGMKAVSKSLNASWESGIFGEPTGLKLGVGHKGIYTFDIEVDGKASHSGYPELGISATEILVPVLDKLLKMKLPESKLLGPSTLNIGMINAGVAQNVLPAKATSNLSIRVADKLSKVREIVLETIGNVEHLTLKSEVQVDAQYLDYKVPGFDSVILAYSTDIPNLSVKLKHRFLYGPGSIHVAHGANEYIENSDLILAIDGYKKLIKHALQN